MMYVRFCYLGDETVQMVVGDIIEKTTLGHEDLARNS